MLKEIISFSKEFLDYYDHFKTIYTFDCKTIIKKIKT